MRLEHFRPSLPLSTYIEDFCFAESDIPLHTQERCLPTGSMAVVINLGHNIIRAGNLKHTAPFQDFRRGIFNGAFSQYTIIDPTTLLKTISINFRPDGARLFLTMPATEITNQVVDLFTLWGPSAFDLYEQLQAAPTRIEMIQILERFLLTRITQKWSPHPAIPFALAMFRKENGQHPITEVTDQLGMRPKRFIRLFEETIGLTPKVFCRLLRFQEALSLTEGEKQRLSWTDLALSCGYFDQAHFIHDFHAFSGLTPQMYLAQRSPHRNHVPLS